MFDTIRCEWPLPDGRDGACMQTKTLGSLLDTYLLTAQGALLRIDGSDTGFHGVLRMLTADPGGLRREYEAKFTDGKLDYLVPIAMARFDENGMALNPLNPT